MKRTMYTKDKSNRIRVWEIYVDDFGLIKKSCGLVDGKQTFTVKQINSGKNIGKSNETTVYQQALIEANYLIKKQTDQGYVDTLEELDSRIVILPMLANKWGTMKHYMNDTPYVYSQPKLDGVRMLVGKINGEVIMMSRTGKDILHMDHIKNEIEPLMSEGDFLDGENFSSELLFEEITGLCRTSLDKSAQSKDMKKIQFHIFDYFNISNNSKTFEQRLKTLQYIFEKFTFKYLVMVETEKITNIDQVHGKYMSMGFEGTMIRHPNSKYHMGERSNYLLKHKDFETEEYRIVDAVEATGRDKGTVIWVCEIPSGQLFNVRPKGIYDTRKSWFSNRKKFIGKLLTVQFQNLSPNGIPRFPVGINIRDYE